METIEQKLMKLAPEAQAKVLDVIHDNGNYMEFVKIINNNPSMCIADAAMVLKWKKEIKELKENGSGIN